MRVSDLVQSDDDKRSLVEHQDLDEKIEDLYDELIVLVQQHSAEDGLPPDEEIKRCYDRLLEFQTAAAERFRRQFNASLAMPLDAGAKVLARIRDLKEELEDLAFSDATPSGSGRGPDHLSLPRRRHQRPGG